MKVSVIVPVCNAAATLSRCLDSLAAQTFRDFEVVCVDDGSTDGGLGDAGAAVRRLGAGAVALRVIRQENAGTLVARKRGVEASSGDYVCFVDPDDRVKPRFLEKLVGAAERGGWDIVQCGVELEETRERTPRQRAVSERYFNPDAPTVRGGGLLTRVYVHTRIGWNLIFRLFRASVVREAFAELPEVNMINETDAAAFFGIAARARRFRRIRDRLYVYRYGEGISTRLAYSPGDFRRTLGKFDFLRAYAARIRGADAEAAFVAMARRMCENSRKSACARLPAGEPRDGALRALRAAVASRPRRDAIRHVGIHYFNLRFGGVQRVVLQKAALLRSLGLKVTLFLEDAPDDGCFPVPEGVGIRLLPRSLGNLLPEEVRIPRVAAALRDSGIDCWYDHAIFAPGFATNAATAKWLLGLPVVAHYHTVFTAPLHFRIHPEYFELQSHVLRLADVALVLGRVDAAFFRSQAVSAVVMPNALPEPCLRILREPLPQPVGRTVLWCGRDSWEKHPEDARAIGRLVKARLPDVELRLLSGVKDPYPHFAQAAVFLSTSEMEGFSMASAEALAHGLPVVAYRLDNLDLYRDNPAVFSVPQGDVRAAADKIVEILTGPEYPARRLQARASLRPFVDFDQADFWRAFCAGAAIGATPASEEDVRVMERLLAEGLAWRAAHPKPPGRDPVTLRRIRRYVRDNGFWYAVGKAVRRIFFGRG